MAEKKAASGQIWANANGSGRVKVLKADDKLFKVRTSAGKKTTLKSLGKRVYIKG